MPFLPLKIWSLAFLWKWLQHMSLPSALAYWRLERARGKVGSDRQELVPLKLKTPIAGTVWIRNGGTDSEILTEIVSDTSYRALLPALSRCEYVIDLGANIGLTSRFIETNYPGASFVVVEPDQENFEILSRNLGDLTRQGRCRMLHRAVWSDDRLLALEAVGPLQFDSFQARPAEEKDSSAVQGITIQEVIHVSGFPRIDLLKVDIEGAETELFKGSLDWLRLVHAIAIEFHGNSREESGFDRIMQRYGFVLLDAGPPTFVAVRFDAGAGSVRPLNHASVSS